MSKKAIEWPPKLIVHKNVLLLGALFLLGFVWVEYHWAVVQEVPVFRQCHAEEWQDSLAGALEQWKERNSSADVYSDSCLANLDRADIKRMFVAIQQMLKEDICSSGNSRQEKRALDRIFGRAFKHGIVNA